MGFNVTCVPKMSTTPTASYNFTGKVALVTGSSSGIGKAIALQLAQYGAKVTITGRDVNNLAKVAEEIEKASGNSPLQVIGDLTVDKSLPEKLVNQTVAKYGKLDFLVNNAGTLTPNETFENPNLLAQYDQVMNLNVRSVLAITQQAVPHLEKTKGAIVNIGSIASAAPHHLVYSPSKAALDMLTKTSASQLASKGIRVNSVNPGPVYTAGGRCMGKENFFRDNEDMIKGWIPLKRIAEPVEMASLVTFLLSDLAVNITGSIVVSDGGALVASKS